MRMPSWKEKCQGRKEAAAVMTLPQEFSRPTCSFEYAENMERNTVQSLKVGNGKRIEVIQQKSNVLLIFMSN